MYFDDLIDTRRPNAGETAMFVLPTGLQYHDLVLEYSGITLAQITSISVITNKKVQYRNLPATVLDTLRKFEGGPAANGFLVIPFNRYNLNTRAAEESTALVTGAAGRSAYESAAGRGDGTMIEQLEVEVKTDAAALGPIVLTLRAVVSEYLGGPRVFRNIEFFSRQLAVGNNIIRDVPQLLPAVTPDRAILARLGVNDAATVTDFKIVRNSADVFERTRAFNEERQASGVRVPQANWMFVDPSERGYALSLQVAGFQNFAIELNANAAASRNFLAEYHGTLAGS